jgi:hypothetical protein
MGTQTTRREPAATGSASSEPRFTSRTVTITPGSTKTVGLGTYGVQAVQPEFSLTFKPDMMKGLVGASLDRLDIPGKPKYMLLYQFRNNGDKDCTIEVRHQA